MLIKKTTLRSGGSFRLIKVRSGLFALIIGSAASVVGCMFPQNFSKDRVSESSSSEQMYLNCRGGQQQLGVELLAAVSENGRKNALISPLGIEVILAMLAQGASDSARQSIESMIGTQIVEFNSHAGDDLPRLPVQENADSTESDTGVIGVQANSPESMVDNQSELPLSVSRRLDEVIRTAGVDDGVTLNSANGAFIHQSTRIFPSFIRSLNKDFDAHVERMDFSDGSSVSLINNWVSEQTQGEIPNLLTKLDPLAKLVLVSAMYFDGLWAQPFDPLLTKPRPFHVSESSVVDAPMMQSGSFSASYRESEAFQAVLLPYGNQGEFVAVVLLPRQGIRPSEAMCNLALDPTWLGGAGFTNEHGFIELPHIQMDESVLLLTNLRKFGLESVLNDDEAFSGIASPSPILSQVVHGTMLMLDEAGTKAAAATGAVMSLRSETINDEAFEMRVNRPFTLAIRHMSTGALLFLGWIANPTSE